MSYREKSLAVLFVGLAGAFGFYFLMVLPPHAADVMPQHVAVFVAAIALLIATQVIGHVLALPGDRTLRTDERDRLIALAATRNGAYVLACGVFAALCVALVTPGNFAFTHVLLGAWVVAQLVQTGSELVYHRRGT